MGYQRGTRGLLLEVDASRDDVRRVAHAEQLERLGELRLSVGL